MFAIITTLYAGLEHAFETDHLLAVNSIVSNRNNIKHSIKDGIYWGLGHTATILFVALFVFFFKLSINEALFKYLEAVVGLMLVLLGSFRLVKYFRDKNKDQSAHEKHVHYHTAFRVGLVHGLAGSGAIMILILSKLNSIMEGITYILIFGFGSVIGMFIASGLFSFPFSKSILTSKNLQFTLIFISSALCIAFGGHVIYSNLIALN